MSAVSPLAPTAFPDLPPVGGVRLATHAAGLRYQGRADLFAALCDPGTTVAGTFTRSLCPSAPVDWCRTVLDDGAGSARAVVCNAGNANAFTGRAGVTATEATAAAIADAWSLEPHEILLASTGVIGETLPTEALVDGLGVLAERLEAPGPEAWHQAAVAIGTTDTFPKGAAARAEFPGGSSAQVVGVAKGSGMIAPDMATMLSFVFTDAAVAPDVARAMLRRSVGGSYNRITVDSDTSTSDTVLWFCTGAAGGDPIVTLDDPRVAPLQAALDEVNLSLAHQIVRDGEGATKFVAVTVTGAEHDAAAERIAFAIGNSPLVKTALAASDANWGRIVMAVGKAGERAERDRLAIWIGDEHVAEGGLPRDDYEEARATEHLRGDEVELRVDVGVGDGRATIWTCDLTHGYIEINAGYRT